MPYDQIVKTLREHLKPNKLMERYKFKELRQSPTETILEYLAAMKKIAILTVHLKVS